MWRHFTDALSSHRGLLEIIDVDASPLIFAGDKKYNHKIWRVLAITCRDEDIRTLLGFQGTKHGLPVYLVLIATAQSFDHDYLFSFTEKSAADMYKKSPDDDTSVDSGRNGGMTNEFHCL